jgi:hypothetical protein
MSESRFKTRVERNTEIIKEVYNFLLLNVSNKFSDNEKFYKEFAIEKFLSDRLYCSWSWIDLITLINLIKVALIDNGLKEEFEKRNSDENYGSWCFFKVKKFCAELIADYPDIIEKIYKERMEKSNEINSNNC